MHISTIINTTKMNKERSRQLIDVLDSFDPETCLIDMNYDPNEHDIEAEFWRSITNGTITDRMENGTCPVFDAKIKPLITLATQRRKMMIGLWMCRGKQYFESQMAEFGELLDECAEDALFNKCPDELASNPFLMKLLGLTVNLAMPARRQKITEYESSSEEDDDFDEDSDSDFE